MAILEGFSPLPPFGSPSLLHLEAEAMRRAYIDRSTELGDPSFVSNPVDRLLSEEYTGSLRRTIEKRATPTVSAEPASRRGPSTTHYSVVDSEGTAVSTTTTLNDLFGSAVTVTGAGFLLNDEMDDFVTQPRSPLAGGLIQGEKNQIAPGKRMLSSMAPTIVLDGKGELFMVLGSRGGTRIITQIFQVVSNVADHRMDLAEAVAAPRMHHQASPDILGVEPRGFLPGVLDSLRRLGHSVDSLLPGGDVEAIMRVGGRLVGVSDPRSGGGGAGY
jgi:gamma-glutamyltranspeptidase/glutathione hydrolase